MHAGKGHTEKSYAEKWHTKIRAYTEKGSSKRGTHTHKHTRHMGTQGPQGRQFIILYV